MPIAAECECEANCSRIGSANMEYKDTAWNGDADSQHNQNQKA